jgi:hypothetical protein
MIYPQLLGENFARLPAARHEFRLHAIRDFAYAIVFGSLAWLTWNGLWIVPLAGILLLEICITFTDFLEADRTLRLPPASASCAP